MGQLSRKALSVVLSGLLATSMFTALPARAGATEELEPVPMQQEKQPSGNASQAPQGTAQMGEDTAPAPANDAQSLELTAQSDDAAAQSDDAAAQSTELAAQSEEGAAQPTVLVAQNASLPSRFDLRDKGAVTPVKIQNPWQSCWAFGSIAAAETSILSMLQEKGRAVDPKTFDLSEKHLVWFGLNTITEAIDPTQVGEGMLVTGTTANVGKAVYDNGGYGLNASTLFACGVGPVYEKYFPYQGDTGLTERQYLDEHPQVKNDVILETCAGLTGGLTPEDVVSRLRNDDQKVINFLDTLRGMGCLDENDNSKVTTDVLGQAFLTYYMKKNKDNAYTKRDDWSIPETGNYEGQEVLNRNVTSGFTMVDGNKLPSLSIKNAKGKWISINQEGIDAVKSELAKGRGVSAGFQADQAAPGEDVPEKYMSTKTWAHYTYEDKGTSHMICIVGWDDDYPASNFLEGHQPPADGAWLVKNSWGSETDYVTNDKGADIAKDAWGIKDASGKHTGYFWISYYDKSLNYCESMSFDTDLADADGEMATLMYDYMPSLIGARTGQDTSEQSEGVVKTANVFKNDTGEYTKLASVSTRTAHPKATVKYSVYRLKDGSQNPEDGELAGTATATYEYAGFHRERLDGSIVLWPGETFAVVAEETVEEGGKTLHEYAANIAYTKAHAEAVQAQEAASGVDSDNRDRNADEYGIAVVNKGESFIFDNGAWTDWTEYEPRTAISGDYAIDNFSIKAYLVSTSEPTALAITGSGHVQNVGDVNGEASGRGVKVGTEGQALRLENFALSLPEGADGGIEYRGHVQNKGWDEWVAGGKSCGTAGQALRLEAVQVRLTGKLADTHDVWYRVHAQNFGTLGWARDGQAAGTAGQALRVESLEVQVLPKGEKPDGYEEGRASYVGAVTADVHVQNTGWTGAQSALEFGTTGQARRLEAIRLSQPATPVDGGITYEVHAQDKGWMPAAADGALAGTTGEAKRLEAVRVSLTGDAAKEGGYSVWYRVHSQDYGWLGWAHDGAEAGTSGLAKRAEAIDVQILPQGQVPAGYDAGKAACVTA